MNDATVSKFVRRKWIEVNYLLSSQHSANKNIMFKSPTVRSDLFDYSHAYTIMKGAITAAGSNANNWTNKELALRIMLHVAHAYQKSCIQSYIHTFINNADDPDIVMSMYNNLFSFFSIVSYCSPRRPKDVAIQRCQNVP